MPAKTYLAFDFGLRRIGVAVGESITGGARPLETLRCPNRGQVDWRRITQLLEQWKPDALVVGRPLQADGTESDFTLATDRFSRRLEGRFGLPVHRVDEGLSSMEARERMREMPSGARQDRETVDRMAAKIILETWLADKQ